MTPPLQSHAARLAALRASLDRAGLTGFIVPHADEYQSEYLPPSAERLTWLTGFTGSAGTAIVLADAAAVFVDGRYTLQADAEVDGEAFSIHNVADTTPVKWLASLLNAGDRIGYDPWLMTVAEVRRFSDACSKAEAALVPVVANPIDELWGDRPDPPLGAVALHPVDFAGEAAARKIKRLQDGLAQQKVGAAVLATADSVAWTFNIRGADIAHNPGPLAYSLLLAEGRPQLFVDGRKLSNTVRTALSDLAEIDEPVNFPQALAALGATRMKVLLDPKTTAEAIAAAIREAGGVPVDGADPAVLPKATKNPTELAGARAAHVRDGAAMVRFLCWLDRTAPTGQLDEIAAAEKLEALRAETAQADGSALVDLSFDTISGAGPNGAIVHYRVTPESNRPLESGTLYLVDSGAQYRDGTTDITRTVSIGTPSDEMRDRFTRVLKGHIAIATARFPVGTTGAQLDSLARIALWRAGLDYDHGTGHGVGSFLSVHEGPARISKLGNVPLEPGMILSNEPGYYKAGEYGIRIENLEVVTPTENIPGGDRPMLGFSSLTLCPIDLRLVYPSLLTREEIAWLDEYHAKLAPALSHLLDAPEQSWLAKATQPLSS